MVLSTFNALTVRKLLRVILLRPILWAANRFASRPVRARIFEALDELLASSLHEPGKRGLLINFTEGKERVIIFSDQHKGARNGADDFTMAEPNYLAALDYYNRNEFCMVSLGDSEELWENTLSRVREKNEKTFEAEKKFVQRKAFAKVIGNHDLYWGNDPLAPWQLKNIYGRDMKIYEGVMISTMVDDAPFRFFCTHGHQGDAQSDGNWFSKFFISRIWAPLQAYLRINPNTPAYDSEKKTLHNEIMYEWSAAQKDIVLITGHTHQPVFASLTHIERLYKDFQWALAQNDPAEQEKIRTEIRKREREFTAVSIDYLTMRPSYFNSGCCCFSDGDITGIEIAEGYISLIKWELIDEKPQRIVLEELSLAGLKAKLA